MKLLLFALLASFCQEIPVEIFDEIKSSGSFPVFYIQSDQPKVVIEGKEDQVKKIQANVFGETLFLKMENGNYSNLDVKVSVYAPCVEEIIASGSGAITAGEINMPGKDFSIKIMGSGSASIKKFIGKEIELETYGSGSIKVDSAILSGDAELKTNGSGSITINGKCEKVEAATRGSGSIKGSLKYKTIDKTALGSGKISL